MERRKTRESPAQSSSIHDQPFKTAEFGLGRFDLVDTVVGRQELLEWLQKGERGQEHGQQVQGRTYGWTLA
jgi:hypothetical protein